MDRKKYERPVIIKQYGGMMNKFGSTPVQPPMTEIDTVSVKNLLEDYGSPLFVFSEKKTRANQRKMHRIFKTRYPKVQFAWSYKTNFLNSVCSVFHQEGSWAEVVSEYEYLRAERLGVPGEFIIFNGPDKNKKILEKAIRNKSKIHIDHFDELYEIIELTESLDITADVAIRVNMDVGIYPLWDRFGFNYENGEALQALKRIISCKNINLIGLHTHIGTYIMNTEPYSIAATKMVELANYIKNQYGIVLDYIDMGGGLPSQNTLKGQYLNAEQMLPSYEEYADAITKAIFNYNVEVNEMPTLILETGRALIDDAGYLLSSVIGNKRLSSEKKAVVIDAGVNLLFTSHWFNHKIVPAQQSNGTFTENSAIYGPLCMNIDCLSEDIVLPALNKGDRVVIQYVGAYSVTQWMQFITVRPKVVMIMEDKSVEIIRDSETINYLLEMEKIPQKLEDINL